MLSSMEFIKKSLGLHLFFARIMKEHSFFLEVGFTPRDAGYTRQADAFRREFDGILADAITLSDGDVNPELLKSGEVVTPYTLNAETVTSRLTGVQIPTQLTQAELELAGDSMTSVDPWLEERVLALNRRAINATAALIEFKKRILTNVLNCEMFTVNYPLLILHIIREAELYLGQLQRLQNREDINLDRDALEQFWNRQMAARKVHPGTARPDGERPVRSGRRVRRRVRPADCRSESCDRCRYSDKQDHRREPEGNRKPAELQGAGNERNPRLQGEVDHNTAAG